MVFAVPGKPQGKGRPRFSKFSGAYTPKATKDYESYIRECYIKSGGKYIGEEKPIHIGVTAYFSPPKNTPKKNKVLMLIEKILPIKRPDGDNILKIAADALNGVAYHDDKQITDWDLKKRYSAESCLIIKIEEIQLEGMQCQTTE